MPAGLRLAGLLSCLGLVLGCTPEFEDVWLVKDLRILGVQAEPPEVFAPLASASFPPVKLRALIVDPLAVPGELYEWQVWVCTAEEDRCEVATRRQLVRQDRTTLDKIGLDFTLSSYMFLEALKADLGKGFGGVPVMLELQVQREGFSDRAVKRVVYGYPLPPQKTPNQNPSIARVLVDDKEPGGALSVTTAQKVKLLPEPTPGSKEHYFVMTFTGGSRELDEFLTYSFFTTAGHLSDATTGGKPSPFVERKKVDEVSSDWTAADQAMPAAIWVVVRDDRGGVSWTQLSASVKAP